MTNHKFYSALVFGLLLAWSIWFWASHPRPFNSPSEINKWCMAETPETEYCIGYEDGWKYGLEIMEQQIAIEEFETLTSEQIEQIDNILNN